MTDNELIQALRICPSMRIIVNPNAGYVITVQDILDLINRQKAEIERLEKLYKLAVAERDANVKGFTKELNAIKSKAIKEFAEELCEGRVSNDPVVIAVRCAVKEMTEGV